MPPIWIYRAALLLAFMLAGLPSAFACACCTNVGWRYVEVEAFAPPRAAQVELMKFASAAKLMLGEASEGIKGIDDSEENYKLAVTRAKDRITFAFTDEKSRKGTLALAMPKTISIFEVDPRGRNAAEDKAVDGSVGPSLYKEWKLTANAAGDGLFKAIVGGQQKMTLIFHGHGIGCTDASHFTDWTLLVHGKGGNITMFGRLTSADQ